MRNEDPARGSRLRRVKGTVAVAGVVLVLAAIPFVWLSLQPADAEDTVQSVADGFSEGDNDTLRSLICTSRPSEAGPTPEKFVDAEEPVTVRAVEVDGDSATAALRVTADPALEYGMVLVRSEEQGWCVFGLILCPANSSGLGSGGTVTICSQRPR